MIGQFAFYLEQMSAERDWEKLSFVTKQWVAETCSACNQIQILDLNQGQKAHSSTDQHETDGMEAPKQMTQAMIQDFGQGAQKTA